MKKGREWMTLYLAVFRMGEREREIRKDKGVGVHIAKTLKEEREIRLREKGRNIYNRSIHHPILLAFPRTTSVSKSTASAATT